MQRMSTRAVRWQRNYSSISHRELRTWSRSSPKARLDFAFPQTPRRQKFVMETRLFSTTATPSTASKASPISDAFFDNLGKIFLASIAAIIATLVRSSYNTSNRNLVRDHLEDIAALDPIEIEELRLANDQLTPDVVRDILHHVQQSFGTACSYHEFLNATRRNMIRLKGEAFTIQLGHLIDRVVLDVLDKHQKSADDELSLALWMTTLVLAMNSTVGDRIRILFEIMETMNTTGDKTPFSSSAPKHTVPFQELEDMVGYLQETCQLPPDTQIVPTDRKYPTQQWRQGTPEELVPWEGAPEDPMDCNAFATILRSRSVCAWGECYHKKAFDGIDE